MTDFNVVSDREFMEQRQFESEIPGEAFTQPEGFAPMDRPQAFSDPEEFLDRTLQSLSQPKNVRSTLAILKAGVPLDTVVGSMMNNMVAEGAITPQGAIVSTPALTVMLMRMAEAGGVDFSLTSDGSFEEVTDGELFAAQLKESVGNNREANAERIGEMSVDELKKLPNTEEGFLKRPEELA